MAGAKRGRGEDDCQRRSGGWEEIAPFFQRKARRQVFYEFHLVVRFRNTLDRIIRGDRAKTAENIKRFAQGEPLQNLVHMAES